MTDSLIMPVKTDSSINQQAQATVQRLLDELTGNSLETGVQVAAYLDGKLVLDAWSGTMHQADRCD